MVRLARRPVRHGKNDMASSDISQRECGESGGIETFKLGAPGCSEFIIRRRVDAFPLELTEEILGRLVGKPEIAGKKLLIKDGGAQESCDLLFFDRVTRYGQDMTHTRENETCNLPLKRLEKSQLAIREGNDGVGFVQFNAVFRSDGIDRLVVDAEGVQTCQSLSRGLWRDRRVREKEKQGKSGAKPHEEV